MTPSDVPLTINHHRARRRNRTMMAVSLCTGLPLLATIATPPSPRLVWNASASAPIGLYLVMPGRAVRDHDWIVTWLPGPARRLAARRGYLPAQVPAVKQVAARAGHQVCGRGAAILIDGTVVAERRARDGDGRPLPWWSGCRQLRHGELFLLNPASRDSFDGRYAGISAASAVIGRARLILSSDSLQPMAAASRPRR